MALYRFLFAPVLLAVAVFAGGGENGVERASPPAISRQAPAAAPEAAPPVAAERPSPQGEARRPSPRVRAGR
jgi:hypothetical protein